MHERDFRPDDFDSFVVTTGTAHHAVALDLVIGPNRKIFCEKPIALELSETDAVLKRLKERAPKCKLVFNAGLTHR
ncbi:MAG: hypothetical protein EBQ54_07605 [Actinobacteria bacterium]|nr:hypothetical protein [Actinomycetota bacterium]